MTYFSLPTIQSYFLHLKGKIVVVQALCFSVVVLANSLILQSLISPADSDNGLVFLLTHKPSQWAVVVAVNYKMCYLFSIQLLDMEGALFQTLLL